jgi:hypothetical protein
MNLSLGIFDLFATAIPGSLYLLTALYLGVHCDWVDADELADLDTTFAVIGAALGSYLLGHVFAPILRQAIEMVPLWRQTPDAARRDFVTRNPDLAERSFVGLNPFTLLAGLRQHSSDAASEVDRSRAIGLMLRSSSPAFVLAACISLVEAAKGDEWPGGVPVAVLLLVMAGLSLREGRKFGHWALIHTFECAAWIPGVDDLALHAPGTGHQAPHPTD